MLLFLLILLLAAVAPVFLPWWSVVPVALGVAFGVGRTGGKAFLAGFFGVGLGWLTLALWFYFRNNGLLAGRVAQLLPLSGSGLLLALVAAAVGGLVGGLAALSGCWLRQALLPRPVAPAAPVAATARATD